MQPAPAASSLPAETGSRTVLEVDGLHKVYRSRRRGDVVAVDGVSFSVDAGEIVGLLGPNGAGKTTTIKCLCTLVRPTSGRILIDGVDAVRYPRRAVEKVGAVLEGNRNIFWRLTPRENLDYFAALNGIPAREVRTLREELLERFGIVDKADTPTMRLSRGMQQKVAVAAAYIKKTQLLFLDEPTLGLDVETSHDLRNQLREMAASHGRTILLSSHDMDVVQEVCDRVIIINEGRIVTDDKVSNLLAVFKARAYRFTLGAALSESAQVEIKSLFPQAEISSQEHEAVISVELLEPARFYDLVDVLRRHGASVESIDRADPDLEEIFLRIVKGRMP